MKTLTTAEKLYGLRINEGRQALLSILAGLTRGLDAEFRVYEISPRGWVRIQIQGQDADVAENLVMRRIGVNLKGFEDYHASMNLKGRILEGEKVDRGIYVDVGIEAPKSVNALIPLGSLRRQLVDGKSLDIEAIKDLWGLHNGLPTQVHITFVDVGAMRVEAEFSESQLQNFDEWVRLGLDRVLVGGATLRGVREALKITRHLRDIVKVERLGLLETAVVCKMGTEAPGIIHAIGRLLPEASLYSFRPSRVSKVLGIK